MLTQPLNGIAHGNVDGVNPINLSPVGGAQFFVDEVLDGFDGYAIYQQMDGAAATPGAPAAVRHAHDADARRAPRPHDEPTTAALFADLAIFSNLGEDDVSF